MTIKAQARKALSEMGEATVHDIVAAIGGEEGDTQLRKTVGQALGASDWAERTGRGRYRYQNGSQPEKPTTSPELQPLVDWLDDPAFDNIGMTLVARSQDGAFICVDRNGQAWKVEVTVTARLI